ncbi:MAG: HlyD family efflux transporter periplasmic adaptor subunit, partial [Tannerella sp.]|nr:HlyD family efflux transporter periplasmic adaptor subunit [Tannerella sp.]
QMDSCIYYDSVVVEQDFRTDLSLGELQPYYNELILNYMEYTKFDKYSYRKKEIAANQKLLASKLTLWKEQDEQQKVYNEIYKLSKTDHYRDVELWASDVISETQMEQSKMGVLQRESVIKELEITKTATLADIRQMEYNIEVLKAKDEEEKQQRMETFKQALSQFTSQLEVWKQNFVITSPISGKITFTNYWVENQNVKAGDIVMSIVPIATMQTVVRVQFPMKNAGKVHLNQRVNIKLENYPYSEFGFLQGAIASVSEVPDNNYLYTATVILDKGLITSYNRKLDSGVFLKGTADILTDDYSLLLRLFNPLKAFYDEKIKR